MPRPIKKSSGSALPIVIGVVVVIVIAVVLAGLNFAGAEDLEPLPTEAYLEKPGDFLGNRYALRAQIDSQIKWEKDLGRILAVRPEGARHRLPVFVPASIGGNLHTGQRYEMKARIDEGGLIYVEDLRKY